MIMKGRIFLFLLHFWIVISENVFAEKTYNDDIRAGNNLTRREIGYFWHVSDIFFDPNYSPLAAQEDDCRIKSSKNLTKNCGFFGELGQCSAFGLVETIARAMNSTRWKIVAPEFCIFTGNLRCPNVEDDGDTIYETMKAFVTDVRNAGFVNIYPSYGWYDYHPYGHHPLKLTNLYEKLRDLLHNQKSTLAVSETGYFSRIENQKNRIRVIVMNTNFYLKNHIASRLLDPAGQWKWLINELKECQKALQKAFIVMSVPPGFNRVNDFKQDKNRGNDLIWSDRHSRIYRRIISEYYRVIAAQFAGHRHKDTFRLVYNMEGKAVSAVLIAPPINPISGNYPSIRIYMYDKNSGELLDFVQYFFNLTKANLEFDMTNPEKYWEVSYSFRDFYHLPDVTTSSLEKLVKNFRKNDVPFQRYQNKINGVQSLQKFIKCENRCKLISICAITTIDLATFLQCISGELNSVNKRRINNFQLPSKALRDRLLQRNINPALSTSGSVAIVGFVTSSFHMIVVMFHVIHSVIAHI